MSNNNRVPSEQSLLEFSEVMLRAIELSWRDPNFKADLIKDPAFALKHWFHYQGTWHMNIAVQAVEHGEDCRGDKSRGEPVGAGWDNHRQMWNMPRDKITFGLPVAPPDIKDHGVALAMYNDAGPMYLFTCC